jgi:hypothetical protein
MPIQPEFLLARLEAIGRSLSQRDTALALIGLGSVGLELDRLDPFSDLDFFVIVKPGRKAQYLEDLSWLQEIAPIAYSYRNTRDGYKVLYKDGVFCEFAVFEETELKTAAFAPGRIVWKAPGVAEALARPAQAGNKSRPPSTAWLIGEALTNLYVGLLRDHRGEKLSALRFIQRYAVDHVLALAERLQPVAADRQDPFTPARGFERRYPDMVRTLPGFLQGYKRNRASALAVLLFLDQHFTINQAMKQAVLELCEEEPRVGQG